MLGSVFSTGSGKAFPGCSGRWQWRQSCRWQTNNPDARTRDTQTDGRRWFCGGQTTALCGLKIADTVGRRGHGGHGGPGRVNAWPWREGGSEAINRAPVGRARRAVLRQAKRALVADGGRGHIAPDQSRVVDCTQYSALPSVNLHRESYRRYVPSPAIRRWRHSAFGLCVRPCIRAWSL